ncbi:MAG: M48 family metalloprotease, partial [Clostridia bacterium]|nr:M48 family metalloprotease [Clostridia bacterium]
EFVKSVEDEEAIAFVLGHELGHFQNRDHIKGYGRGMVLYLMASLVAGEDSSTSAVFLDILNKTEMKFSQKAELSADAYGATLLYSAYGRYDGAVALFEMFSEEYDHGKMAAYFDSHPHPEIRIEAIKSLLEGIQ